MALGQPQFKSKFNRDQFLDYIQYVCGHAATMSEKDFFYVTEVLKCTPISMHHRRTMESVHEIIPISKALESGGRA